MKKLKLAVSKFGEFLSSRSEGREAALATLSYNEKLKLSSAVELNFDKVVVLTPSWLSEFVQTIKAHGDWHIDFGSSKNLSVQKSVQAVIADGAEGANQRWRLCPVGEHWVKSHPLKTRQSKKNPNGTLTTRREHCAKNPSGKDQLYPDEIIEIAERNFAAVSPKPCHLTLGFKNGDVFDDFIAGWVRYWNDVLKTSPSLDVNLVKALIATESGFEPKTLANKNNSDSARGLLQITNETRKILGDEKGELGNHFLTLSKSELNEPNINICAGVRWLFYKREWASHQLKRAITWEEAVASYKGVLKQWQKGDDRGAEIMKRFNITLKKLNSCK